MCVCACRTGVCINVYGRTNKYIVSLYQIHVTVHRSANPALPVHTCDSYMTLSNAITGLS